MGKRKFHSTFDFQNLCTAEKRSLLFAFQHKLVVKEVKMLIKLIAVDSSILLDTNVKSDSQTLPESILTFALDDNEKNLISEVLDILIGAGTFTSTSSFGTQSLQFVTMNELKKSEPGGFLFKKKITW